MNGFDNDAHARFQRMLLGEPEPEPQPQQPQEESVATPADRTPAAQPAEPAAAPAAVPPLRASAKPPPSATHVDANARWTPRPNPTTPTPPLLAASKALPAQPPSMVSIIQDQWLQLCDYFQRVQCANSQEERLALVRELGTVETSLQAILDALLTDRKQLVSAQRLHTHMSIVGESLQSERGMPTPQPAGTRDGDGGGVSLSSSVPPAALRGAAATGTTSPLPSPGSGFLLDSALTSLPPCYRFLFADAHRDDLFSEGDADADSGFEDGGRTPPGSRQDTTLPLVEGKDEQRHAARRPGAASALDDPSPIGSIFLLTLCQYAKQDEPPGVRSIILEFLVRLLQEADLPTDRAAYPAGDPVLSLLQLNPPLLIVPLLDMLRKVSKALDPSKTALRHGGVALSAPLAYPWAGDLEQDGTFLQDAGRTQFVIFLSSLAEKMERVPALANFFVVEDGADGERTLFVLLDALLPYLTHDCSAPGWTHRRDTCRYALSAVVSLAKCPDPWIQDLVGHEAQVATRTLMAARTTLLTLCKIPDNDDSTTQVLFLRDVLRFWATLTSMSPGVADSLQLYPLIEKEFYFQTLIPLLQSSDTHVYSAACLVAAQVLRELGGSAPLLTRGLATALLGTTIRKSSGRIVPQADHYDTVVVDGAAAASKKTKASAAPATSAATTLGQQEEAAAAGLQMLPDTSFFLYYVVPHLSSNPYLSEDERQNAALLGYSTTRWSTVKATLVLTQALAENVPELFLRQVFLMDMTSLSDVLRKQRLLAATKPSASSTSSSAVGGGRGGNGNSSSNNSSSGGGGSDARLANLGVWSAAGPPPHLSVHDYTVAELHESTLATPALGLQAERVGEAVLTRLLRTEGNMSIDALRARQEVMSAMTEQRPATASANSRAAAAAAAAATSTVSGNCWSHAGVRRSPLTVALCEMVQHLDATPYTVSSLVADVVVSLCVLPDLRVLYTLLDTESGPLKSALCQLRDVLQHRIQTAGAEASTFTAGKRGAAGGAVLPASRGAASAAAAAAAASSTPTHAKAAGISLLLLYDMLLQHWDALMGSDAEAGQEEEEGRNGLAGVPIVDVPLDSLRGAVEANSNVLHACLYLEYLVAHLDAAIGYSALSQNLMYLRTSL